MKKEAENIFSFKKEKETTEELSQIIVDSREKNSMILAHLYEMKAKPQTQKLEVGDYQIGELLIERKTKTDLLNSLKSNRLKTQLKDLKQYPRTLFIVEEDLSEFSSQNENVIEGIVLSIAAHHRVPVIHTTSQKHTAEVLVKLAKKEKTKSSASKLNTQKIPKTKEELQRFILEGFPGVGGKASRALLEHFSTLREIFSADKKIIADLTNQKIADSICDLVH